MGKHIGSFATLQLRVVNGCMINARAGGSRAVAIKRLLKTAGIEPPASVTELEQVSVEFVRSRTNRQNVNRFLDWMLQVKNEPCLPVPKFIAKPALIRQQSG